MHAAQLLNRLTEYRKSQANICAGLTAAGASDGLMDPIRSCGSWLHFREWIECGGEVTLRNANFCKKHLLCRACAARRAGKLVDAYREKVESVMEEYPKAIPAVITLTVKNGKDLGERVRHLKSAWSRMLTRRRQAKKDPERYVPVEWNKVLGSIRGMEVTRKGNGWHPHFHCFVLLADYVDQAKLSFEWQKLTGDSFIVGVTKCKNGIVPGLIETLKYTLKVQDLTPADLLHTFQVLRGNRLVDPQGILRGVHEPDIDRDDDLTGACVDFVAVWLASQRYRIHRADANGGILEDVEPTTFDAKHQPAPRGAKERTQPPDVPG